MEVGTSLRSVQDIFKLARCLGFGSWKLEASKKGRKKMNLKKEHIRLNQVQKQMLKGLLESIDLLLAKHGEQRTNGQIASARTQQARRQVLGQVARCLYDLGYQLKTIQGLDNRHVDALIGNWYGTGVQAKTLQNYVSVLRRLCEWIGKPGVIPEQNCLFELLPGVETEELKVRTFAVESKSWTENGIDVVAKIMLADSIDKRFGAMLRLGLAFGLRRKEQLRIKPYDADGGAKLYIRANVAKSGRDRDIEILEEFQREALHHAKKITGKGKILGWEGLSYEQAINKYNYLMGKRLGITGRFADCVGHGLRAEFAENMALLFGYVPATLGGGRDQMPLEQIKQVQKRVTENMGHGRVEVTSAYYGPLQRRPNSVGRRIANVILPGDMMAVVYMNPMPVPDRTGEYLKMGLLQKERTAVHIEIVRDCEEKGAGIWRIKTREELGKMEGVSGDIVVGLLEKIPQVLAKRGYELV